MLFLFKSTSKNKKRKHSEHFCRSKGPGGSQRASRTYCRPFNTSKVYASQLYVILCQTGIGQDPPAPLLDKLEKKLFLMPTLSSTFSESSGPELSHDGTVLAIFYATLQNKSRFSKHMLKIAIRYHTFKILGLGTLRSRLIQNCAT